MASRATVILAKSADQVPKSAVDGKPTTVYWDICGLGQCPRYALELANVDYVDCRIDAGSADAADYKAVWLEEAKPKMDSLLFPNLPYFLDSEVKLTQSNAILRYLGRKYGLLGDAEHLCDQALEQATDLDNSLTGPCYRDFASLAKVFADVLPGKLAKWVECLGKKKFMTGETVTIADCKVYETFRKIKLIAEHQGSAPVLDEALLAFMARFEAIPAIAAYQASPNYLARPLNNPHAQFR